MSFESDRKSLFLFLDFKIWRQFKYLRVALFGNDNSELARRDENIPQSSAEQMDH